MPPSLKLQALDACFRKHPVHDKQYDFGHSRFLQSSMFHEPFAAMAAPQGPTFISMLPSPRFHLRPIRTLWNVAVTPRSTTRVIHFVVCVFPAVPQAGVFLRHMSFKDFLSNQCIRSPVDHVQLTGQKDTARTTLHCFFFFGGRATPANAYDLQDAERYMTSSMTFGGPNALMTTIDPIDGSTRETGEALPFLSRRW